MPNKPPPYTTFNLEDVPRYTGVERSALIEAILRQREVLNKSKQMPMGRPLVPPGSWDQPEPYMRGGPVYPPSDDELARMIMLGIQI